MKKLYLIALVFISSISSMEQQPLLVQAQTTNKIIEDYYGNRFTIPASCVGLVKLFDHANIFENESPIDYAFSKKEFDFQYDDGLHDKFKAVDTSAQPFFSFFERKAGDVPLSRKILINALTCIKRPRYSSYYEKDTIKSVLAAINYLSPQKEKVLKKFVQRAKEIIPEEELDNDDQIDTTILNDFYGIGAVTRLLNQNDVLVKYDGNLCFIDLSGKSLNNLNGIAKIKILNGAKCYLIDISNNNLKELDINRLLKEIPTLTGLNAPTGLSAPTGIAALNNKITKVIFPRCPLPRGLWIDLNKNNITNLKEMYLNMGSKIDLRNNPLTEDSRKNVERACKLGFLLRNKFWLLDGTKTWANNIPEILYSSGIAAALVPGVFYGGAIITNWRDANLLRESVNLLFDKGFWIVSAAFSAVVFTIGSVGISTLSLPCHIAYGHYKSYSDFPEVFLPEKNPTENK